MCFCVLPWALQVGQAIVELLWAKEGRLLVKGLKVKPVKYRHSGMKVILL